MGASPAAHVRAAVMRVRTAELEQCLLLLPFTSALQLLQYLPDWLAGSGLGAEAVCNVAVLLLRLHQRQLAGASDARAPLVAVRDALRPRLTALRDAMGFNLAAAEALQRHFAAARAEAEV
jgi:U3 small nucleolar RNA-associated protein 12